jgi:hypothetical protein
MTEAISWKYRRSFLTPRNDRLEPGVFVQALNKTTLEVRNCQDLFLTFFWKTILAAAIMIGVYREPSQTTIGDGASFLKVVFY